MPFESGPSMSSPGGRAGESRSFPPSVAREPRFPQTIFQTYAELSVECSTAPRKVWHFLMISDIFPNWTMEMNEQFSGRPPFEVRATERARRESALGKRLFERPEERAWVLDQLRLLRHWPPGPGAI